MSEAMYQIRFIRPGSGSYEYFNAESDQAKVEACETANSYLERRRSFSPNFQPVCTATVVEYDRTTKAAKRGGHRFKLRLQYIEATYVGGEKRRDHWYAPED